MAATQLATEDDIGRTCPHCSFKVTADSLILACEACGGVHHGDCWEEGGGCGVAACPSQLASTGRLDGPSTRALDLPPRREGPPPAAPSSAPPTSPQMAASDVPAPSPPPAPPPALSPPPASSPPLAPAAGSEPASPSHQRVGRAGRRRPFLALAAVALVAAVAGAAALSSRSENAADQSSGQPAQPAVAAQGTDAGAGESADNTSSGASSSAATPPADESNATVTHRAHRPSPARIMRAHFEHIGSGELLAAFRLFVPSYRSRNPSWPTTRGAAAARTNVVNIGTPRYHGGGTADVPVNVFTRDTAKVAGSDTLCRQFTGLARVRLVGRGWRYDPIARPLHGSVREGNSNCP